jgi:uncharacterized protein YgbK (DUF1537 family)
MSVLLGAIADDFTGAADLANTLVRSGLGVVLTIGVPHAKTDLGSAEAVVVALKSRTQAVEDAVADSRAALNCLRQLGAKQFFFKYCSTFDSTPSGNIGPVADALLDDLGTDFAMVCPAFPANGRTVYQGHLFVADQLLSESPMKDHPLTPMSDSNLVRMLEQQSKYSVGLVAHDVVSAGVEATAAACDALRRTGVRYGVVDALSEQDLETIGTAAASHMLITGASGAAMSLAENFRHRGLAGEPENPALSEVQGPAAILAGSCSQATRAQVAYWRRNYPHFQLDVNRIAAGEAVVQEALSWAEKKSPQSILVYSSAEPDEIEAIQNKYGREQAAAMVENVTGQIAAGLVASGTRRFIVAGGETSGAVVSALEITRLKVGPEIEPGVPWMETIGELRIALALKSGNFGSENFFLKALAMSK